MSDTRIKITSSDRIFSTLNEIFDSDRIHTGDTVTFLTDVTLGETITISKKCSFDLNGHYLFVPVSPGIIVKGGVQVDFNNGKIQTMAVEHNEDAIISQGTRTMVVLGKDLEMSTRGTSVHVRKRGGLTVDGASVKATGGQPTIYVEDLYSNLTINDGVVASYERSAISVRSQGAATINGGEIYTESNGLVPENTVPAIIVNGQDTSLSVKGGSIFSEKTPSVSIEQSSVFELDGGTVYNHSMDYQAVEIDNTQSALRMYSGWIYSVNTAAIMSSGIEFGDVQHIQILGGKVGGNPNIFHVAGSGDHGITVSGGYVKGELPQSYLAPGYVVSDITDEDGYAEVILKTWVGPYDESVEFPTESQDIDEFNNPFIAVPDSDLVDVQPIFTTIVEEEKLESTKVVDEAEEIKLPEFVPPIDFLNPLPELEVKLPEVEGFEEPKKIIPPEVEVFESKHHHKHHHPHGLRPEPGPVPGPNPGPTQKEAETFIYNSSVNITNKIHIYRTPSRKTVITEWRGALRIYDGGYFSPDGEEFAVVKFRIPGSGDTVTGYASIFELSHP